MAQQFKGHDIKVGDRLFDILDKMVTVVELFSDQILCEISSRGGVVQKSYSFNGVQSRRQVRTLYWQNPLGLVEPHKDPTIWAAQRKVMEGMNAHLGQFLGAAIEANPDLAPDNSQVTQAQATARAQAIQSVGQPQTNVLSVAERNAAFAEAVGNARSRQSAAAAQSASDAEAAAGNTATTRRVGNVILPNK